MAAAPLADLYEQKAEAYRRFGNGVVAAAALRSLPAGGRVLDIGCASGGLLALLRERAGFSAGIELSSTAAEEAAKVADQVVCAPIEDPGLPFEQESFDLVVIADVLEHLVDPEAALRRAIGFARPGGTIVTSVPNIAYWQARLVVLRGQWRSDPTGTFDSSHLRFFNIVRLHELVRAAGLEGVEIEPVVPALRNHVPSIERLPGSWAARAEAAWQRLGHARPNLSGFQLVATGRRP